MIANHLGRLSRKNILFAIVTFFSFIVSSLAQEETEYSVDRGLYSIVPPSPEASSFDNYVNFSSVDQFTGRLNLNIPLFEIKSGTLSFPLSLSYSSSGIRVDEVSSWVGLGWTLSGGGSINRTVYGLPDEHLHGYNYYSSQINNNLSFFDSLPHFEKVMAAYASRDFEPDVYSYSAGGLLSGSFVEKLPQQYESIPSSDDIIERIDVNNWRITKPNGIVFIFETGEDFFSEGGASGDFEKYISAWYLKEIISPSKADTIRFLYETTYQTQTSSQVQTIVKANSGSNLCGYDPVRYSNSLVTYEGAQLSSIFSKNVRLDFHSKNRTDVGGALALDKIVITDTITGKKREIIFDSKEYGSIYGGHERRRLVLDGLKIISEGDSLEYLMEYNGLDLLPDKNSWSIDHWGYFNGKSNNGLIPYQMHNGVQVGNADREPDLMKIKYGLLSKLIYPTGGWMEIEYEPHTYSKIRYLEVNEIAFNRDAFIIANTYESGNNSKLLQLDYSQEVGIFSSGSGLICPPALDGTYVSLKNAVTGVEIYNKLFTSINETESFDLSLNAGTYIIEAIRECADESAMIRIDYASNPPDTIIQKAGGGVRVKKLRSNSLEQGILEKNYFYSDSSGISSGMLHGMPVYEFSQYLIGGEPMQECMVTNYTSASKHNLGFASGSHVSYDFVTEFSGEIGNSGKIQTTYYNCANQYVLAFPFPADISNDWMRGHPILIETFDNVDNLIKRVSFDYSLTSQIGQNNYYDTIRGIKVGIVLDYSNSPQLIQNNLYGVQPYYHVSASKLLNQQVTIEYFNSGQKNTIEDYAYNLDNHLLRIRERVISGEDTVTRKFKYPLDYNLVLTSDEMSVALKNLIDRNMIYTPIEITGSINEKVTSGQLMLYKNDFPNNVNLSEINQLEINSPLDEQGFIGSSISANGDFLKNEFFKPNIEILLYDTNANVLEFQDNKVKNSFYWGYNAKYPVIKAENISYDSLQLSVFESLPPSFSSLEKLLSDLEDPEDYVKWTIFNLLLRQNSRLAASNVTTFTYCPLNGMTSQTDPNGLTTYYEYDGLGRLIKVLDNDRNVLQEYKYNYANQ